MSTERTSENESTPELSDKKVISHNIAMMDSGMLKLLSEESIGGNAGEATVEGKQYSCAGARGYANAETGEIVTFGNYQDVPEEIRNRFNEFIFRVAFDFQERRGFFKVVDIYSEGFSSDAARALEESASLWNQKHE